MCRVDHYRTLPMIFSTRARHSIFISWLAMTGIPKYRSGRDPSWNLIVWRQVACNASLHPPNIACDLSWFAFKPITLWNSWSVSMMKLKVGGWALLNIITSPANIRWLSLSSLQWGWNWKFGWWTASSICCVKYPWSGQRGEVKRVAMLQTSPSFELPSRMAIDMYNEWNWRDASHNPSYKYGGKFQT